MPEGQKISPETELRSILSRLQSENDRLEKYLTEISSRITLIHPHLQPPVPQPGPTYLKNVDTPREPSLVDNLNAQASILADSANRAFGIIEHLRSII